MRWESYDFSCLSTEPFQEALKPQPWPAVSISLVYAVDDCSNLPHTDLSNKYSAESGDSELSSYTKTTATFVLG